MASKRMFSLRVVNSAKFLKMPVSTQALYFHLGLHADDDGVVEAYTVMNALGVGEDDLKILVAKNFVTVLNDDLVSYINDWNENNKIRPDRKIDSIYKDLLIQIMPEIQLLERKERADAKPKVVDEVVMDNQRTDNGQPTDGQRTDNGQPTDGIGKDRLGKDSKNTYHYSFLHSYTARTRELLEKWIEIRINKAYPVDEKVLLSNIERGKHQAEESKLTFDQYLEEMIKREWATLGGRPL